MHTGKAGHNPLNTQPNTHNTPIHKQGITPQINQSPSRDIHCNQHTSVKL
jgi:hypothetical protein